ncbi:unnamed protein product [Ceutorhynchus assimilis]|uniref:Uncharacterized protein n=1 Tax=Ceutorhynchus assimilis TaxID=467358 RepID=A0A9N9N1Y6_9CUCU|nr:unnamed protein product [Ceutorhynchus assimilis]
MKLSWISEQAEDNKTENEMELDLLEQAEDEKVDEEEPAKKLTRIRQRHAEKWASNIRKECFDRGEEYISVRKKIVPARKIKTKKDCLNKCIYKCAQKVSENQRREIFSNYYKLDANEKRMFILNITVMFHPERRRKGKNAMNSKKQNSFTYFFTIQNDKIQPKKDRCDLCAEIEIKGNEENVSEELGIEYKKHLKEKQAMRENRKKDRENDIPVLCFDLENVLSCPKAEIKNFFYKSKLSVYNMTAHLSVNKDVYCAVWSEAVHGRSGNDIASAVYKILNQVL